MAARFLAGASGYSYNHWGSGVFYPSGLPANERLAWYASIFRTVELNTTFYRLPSPAAASRWAQTVPEDFVFATKGSRYITHQKKLKDCTPALQRYFRALTGLNRKLEVCLWQLPPGLPAGLDRLERFLNDLRETAPPSLRHAFEFRNESWFNDRVYELLRRSNAALAEADSDKWPSRAETTADFAYLRFHGRPIYGADYSEDSLEQWAGKIAVQLGQGRDVYAYFNNDANGYAVKDARHLLTLIR